MTFNDVFIQGNGYISYCFHEYNMTCTCERCNQKRVIDCLFVKVDVNLHIARQTQLFLKINSLSPGTMAESCWESSSEEELFLTQSTFTVKSDEYDGKYLLSRGWKRDNWISLIHYSIHCFLSYSLFLIQFCSICIIPL